MITGWVNGDLEAVISIRVGFAETETTIDVILDTGFSGYLTLPPDLITSLGLLHFESADVRLANGQIERVDVFHARIYWDDDWRRIFVQASDGDILGGMSLLQDCSLGIDVVAGGDVTIAPLS